MKKGRAAEVELILTKSGAPPDHRDVAVIRSAAWLQLKEHCTVRCFRPGQADKYGHLRHVGKGWRFDYEPGRTDDDEAFFRLDKHLIARGLYLTIAEEGGVQQPFRIATVTPLAEAA